MGKRLFDISSSLLVLILFSPFFLMIALWVVLDSKGGVFFRQLRVGRNGKPFYLYKFRTMKLDSESKGQLTVGKRDNRITSIGYYLRKYKLDEFPQLINVIKGEMSIVGPRPEVPKYVDMYTAEQKKVLAVRPGLTDYASIAYIDENELLAKAENPEKEYIEVVMPVKLQLNLKYISEMGFSTDLKIILKTIGKILS